MWKQARCAPPLPTPIRRNFPRRALEPLDEHVEDSIDACVCLEAQSWWENLLAAKLGTQPAEQ